MNITYYLAFLLIFPLASGQAPEFPQSSHSPDSPNVIYKSKDGGQTWQEEVHDEEIFESTNNGKTWRQVYAAGSAMKAVESNGVLMATGQKGILRSFDDGKNWDYVISEGGVGIAIEPIKGGFAAITYSTESKTRRVRTSYDGGNTWQPIDAGLPASLSISSIIQVGENFFCGHPEGVFRSSDQGKTWKLRLPSKDDKVFNLSASGNVIYAVPRNGGC